jgi:uncharacterized membrane protein (UPF0127 family)
MMIIFLSLFSAAAQAQTTSLIFERAQIRIDSPAPDEKEKNPKPPHPSLRVDAEVRGEDALKLEYIHTLNTLAPNSGVMIVFDSPSIASLPPMKVYTPVDVLFVADDGRVLQISPNVVLAEITQNVQAKAPVKAFLFLKAGQAAAQGLHPHDNVVGSMFTPPLPSQE